MVVEQQQIPPVIHRSRRVRLRDAAAELRSLLTVIRPHQADGCAPFFRPVHESEGFGCRHLVRQHVQLDRFRTIHAKRSVPAVMQQILQLRGTPRRHAGSTKRLVESPVAGRKSAPHKNFPHQCVHERGVNSVPAEMAGAGEPVPQPLHPAGKAANISPSAVHCFSMPASRPVEKAICRLYPPVSASRSSTSPAK